MRTLCVVVVFLFATAAFAKDTVRVIVGVRIAEEDQKSPEKKKEAAKAAKAKFFERHADVRPLKGHDYDAIPFFTAEVSRKKLEKLAADEDVASIHEDRELEPSLMDSAGIVGAPAAWSQGKDGSGQVVAILDTGVDTLHPFFGGRVVHEACFSTSGVEGGIVYQSYCANGGPSQIGQGTGKPCPDVNCYHGTHVAGIAAGKDPGGANATGFSGMARNASIISLLAARRSTAGGLCNGACARFNDSDVLAALNYLDGIRNLYDIAAVNLSLNGSTRYTSRAACDAGNPAYASMAATLRAHGIAVVGTAGNSGSLTGTAAPGCLSMMINTGATTKNDTVAGFSNSYPGMIDLLAPGDGFTPQSGIYSSFPNGIYNDNYGTSMAAPHVTGAMAILRQASPNAPIEKLIDDLKVSGVSITDTRNNVAAPRIAIAAALARADSTPPSVPGSFTATGSASSVTLTWQPSTDDRGLLHYTVERRDSGAGAWISRGTTATTSFTESATPDRAFHYRVAAVDTSHNASAFASDFAVTVVFTTDPIVAGATTIAGVHQAELRRAVDGWRLFAGLPAAFASYAPLTGPILAADVNAAVNALNQARGVLTLPAFVYSGVPAPAPGVVADDAHVQQMRSALK